MGKPTPVIVTIHRPELTPAEKAERMAEIKKAATGLVAATMRNKAQATRPA